MHVFFHPFAGMCMTHWTNIFIQPYILSAFGLIYKFIKNSDLWCNVCGLHCMNEEQYVFSWQWAFCPAAELTKPIKFNIHKHIDLNLNLIPYKISHNCIIPKLSLLMKDTTIKFSLKYVKASNIISVSIKRGWQICHTREGNNLYCGCIVGLRSCEKKRLSSCCIKTRQTSFKVIQEFPIGGCDFMFWVHKFEKIPRAHEIWAL